VFAKQGHYAFDPTVLAECLRADTVLDKIGDLIKRFTELSPSAVAMIPQHFYQSNIQ
jgi:hypothetical protein